MSEKDALNVGNKVHEDLLKYAEDRMKVLLVGEDSSARLCVMRALLAAQENGIGIIVVDGGLSSGLHRGREPSIQNIPTEEYLKHGPECGHKADLCIFDEWEDLERRCTRGSGKTLSSLVLTMGRFDYSFFDYEPEPPADKRKGPKGPRGKWGKLK